MDASETLQSRGWAGYFAESEAKVAAGHYCPNQSSRVSAFLRIAYRTELDGGGP